LPPEAARRTADVKIGMVGPDWTGVRPAQCGRDDAV